jgi:sterol desaturase/sphingolipid hydroxylase (fatty acid hydroxylase superfamily)
MPYAPYLYAATLIILLAEIIAGRHRGIYERSDWWVTLGCVAGSAVTRPIVTIAIAAIAGWALPSYRGALTGTNPIVAFLAVFVLTEFAFYWVHRWAHEAKDTRTGWLWKLHRTHHSGKYMNVGVTVRINPFWSFVVTTPWVLGFATYLGLQQAAGFTILTIYGWNLITHSHFRWDDAIRAHPVFGKAFRAMEHVLVSPGMHHSHHGFGKDGGNFRNYAVTLSIFDWMFGTLFIPKGRPWKYGVPGPNAHWSEEVLFPIVRKN